jgi:hypothetical protein
MLKPLMNSAAPLWATVYSQGYQVSQETDLSASWPVFPIFWNCALEVLLGVGETFTSDTTYPVPNFRSGSNLSCDLHEHRRSGMSSVPFSCLLTPFHRPQLAAVLAINRMHATIEQPQQCSHDFTHARSSTCPLRPPHNQQLPPLVPLQVHHRWHLPAPSGTFRHLPNTHHRLQVWRLPLNLLCHTAPPRQTPVQVRATEA